MTCFWNTQSSTGNNSDSQIWNEALRGELDNRVMKGSILKLNRPINSGVVLHRWFLRMTAFAHKRYITSNATWKKNPVEKRD